MAPGAGRRPGRRAREPHAAGPRPGRRPAAGPGLRAERALAASCVPPGRRHGHHAEPGGAAGAGPSRARPGSSSWEDEPDEPAVSLSLATSAGEPARHTLDGVAVSTRPDRRRFAAASLLPAVDEAFARLRGDLADWPDPHPGGRSPAEDEYSRCLDPGKLPAAGRPRRRMGRGRSRPLGSASRDAGRSRGRCGGWASPRWRRPGSPRARAPRGTQPIVVGIAPSQGADEAFVQVGVGDPVEVLERQPDCGCDACDTGSADLLETVDDAFVLALSGGVHVVREGGTGRRAGPSTGGAPAAGSSRDEPERWLAEADAGRRTNGVVRGEPWL